MQQKQVVLKKIGDKYVSATNSLVVEMEESKDEFLSKGFQQFDVGGITKIDERFIIENHPELKQQLESGVLRVEPIQTRGWRNRNGHFHEIDYKIVRAPRPAPEQYIIQEENPIEQIRQFQPYVPDYQAELRRAMRQLQNQRRQFRQSRARWSAETEFLSPLFLGFHDPIYVFYENQPGKLRGVVLEILTNLIELTTVAAAMARGKESRRFKQSIKELAQLQGLPESTVMQRIDSKVQRLISRPAEPSLA